MNDQLQVDRTGKRKWVFPTIAITVMVLAVFGVPFLWIPVNGFLLIHKADGGFRKAKRTIRPEELRSWALTEIANHSGTNVISTQIPQSEIPDYIKHLYSQPPEDIWVNPKIQNSEGCVAIMWGGGVFHWGFAIGSTNLLLPQTNGDYRAFEWCPGIYYQHEAGWGLL